MSNATAGKCPQCGTEGAGRFCQECGAVMGGRPCPSCGETLTDAKRFCHACGAAVGGGRPTAGPGTERISWVALGVAGLALLVGVGSWFRPLAPVSAPPAAPQAPAPSPTADLSSLTPRQQANRLFDRVMAAVERGDQQEATFFRPMAVEAYQALGRLDDDARYDLGMVYAVTGSLDLAAAQLDTLQVAEPDHLLGILLEETIASAGGDQASIDALYDKFLSVYDSQMATGRPEYRDHGRAIEAFRAQAAARE